MREGELALPRGQRLKHGEEQCLLRLLLVRKRSRIHVFQKLVNHSIEDGECLLLLAVYRTRNAQKGLRVEMGGNSTFTKLDSTS